jgi:hexosaminidase
MNKIVKKHGKRTMLWEGFADRGRTPIPRDIVVMAFECRYNFPPRLLADGYRIINAAWQPLYVTPMHRWSPEHIYAWNHYRWESCWNTSKACNNPIVVPPTRRVVGAQLCSWEQSENQELPSLRERLAALSERLWNPTAGCTFAEFSRRFQFADAGLGKLLNQE